MLKANEIKSEKLLRRSLKAKMAKSEANFKSIHETEHDKNRYIKHELDRIRQERHQTILDREKRKLEYKKLRVISKNKMMDDKLAKRKKVLLENQNMMLHIDMIKDLVEFK